MNSKALKRFKISRKFFYDTKLFKLDFKIVMRRIKTRLRVENWSSSLLYFWGGKSTLLRKNREKKIDFHVVTEAKSSAKIANWY